MAHFEIKASATKANRGPSVLRFLTGTMDTWRQRQALKTLDGHMLCDIGKSYKSAKAESGKPIWNVPPHWLR